MLSHRRFIACLSALAVLAPLAGAGSAAEPDVVDPADPAGGRVHLDLRKGWFTHSATHLSFSFGLRDLGEGMDPADHGDGSHHYEVEFTPTSQGRILLAMHVGVVESRHHLDRDGSATAPSLFRPYVGTNTTARSGVISATAPRFEIDVGEDRVTLSIPRVASGTSWSWDLYDGIELRDLTVRTALREAPVEGSGLAADVLGPSTTVDEAKKAGRAYVLR